ncbi:hypothetical protein G3545_26320 [Starkeya sp. ORNL1]|uniref:DUF6505 family protein n=1 Tax=Starkeya sp. ORNL1 TaxID=2709380 RepID=UPI001462BFFA|nr:DUF6505 family protein [Starkeya sp. ORNL1]QJP16844.1 hypothetical protein G3545_26320 [Starkeya sp. ORNL1]
MKLLRTIRLDISDTFVFEQAAEPGEWAVSGAFMFARHNITELQGKARTAFRAGFLGVGSFGHSSLAQVVEASAQDRHELVGSLASQLIARCGAPDLTTAMPAAEEEVAFVESLCEHPDGLLIAVSRSCEETGIREVFRTLRPRADTDGHRPFQFVEVIGDDEAPEEHFDLTTLERGDRT